MFTFTCPQHLQFPNSNQSCVSLSLSRLQGTRRSCSLCNRRRTVWCLRGTKRFTATVGSSGRGGWWLTAQPTAPWTRLPPSSRTQAPPRPPPSSSGIFHLLFKNSVCLQTSQRDLSKMDGWCVHLHTDWTHYYETLCETTWAVVGSQAGRMYLFLKPEGQKIGKHI